MSIFRKTYHDYLEEFGAEALAGEIAAFALCGLGLTVFWMMTP